jgi:hypothetical protein
MSATWTETSATWTEEYAGGSAEAERREFEDLAWEIMQVQLKNQRAASAHSVPHGVDRAFHAKATLAVTDAELRFLDLPGELRAGFAQPGATYPTVVRFSNAAGNGQPDFAKDLRGVALRITVSPDEQHDLLMTNFPVSHARNARQFVAFANATAGGTTSRLLGLVRLAFRVGPRETVRMLQNVQAGRGRKVGSVATETYWSRGAIRWGGELAVRYLLRPAAGMPAAPGPSQTDPAYLSREAARRLAAGDVRMELSVQRYRDAKSTPIEDTAIAWSEEVSPPEPVAILTISRRDVADAEHRTQAGLIEAMAFNPWNTTEEFRPLGNLNRARKAAYDASAAHRLGQRWRTDPPLRNRVLLGAARAGFTTLNRFIEWHRLPVRLSLLNLTTFRDVLRRQNLIDTEGREAPPKARQVPRQPSEEDRVSRTINGRANDLSAPEMGAVDATFGRNLRPDPRPDLDVPNPITVSRELLVRRQFLPAASLNLLAAAWIQFQVHDWVTHARHLLGRQDVIVPLPEGVDGWVNVAGGSPEPYMRIAGNRTRGEGPDAAQRLFGNVASHWWDGSEVYGSDPAVAAKLREGPRLRLTRDGYLPEDVTGMEVTGFNESWWLGLSGMHTLFVREHNAVCDELRAHYRGWSDDRVYQTARLIVAALIAKIHTIEWTPAILGTRALELGMNINWSGPPAADWITRLGLWMMDEHATVGIPRTKPDHHRVPYSLTEDFVTVYRMHPLVPDDYCYLDHRTGHVLGRRTFPEIQGTRADEEMRALGLANMLYSFGRANPGAITLHNYPRSLTDIERDGERIDLSVVDLVRSRHRGVPRYNDFRAGLHKPRVKRWQDLTADPDEAELLREVYRDRIDDVDAMVGLFAETPPPGFGFSDTAFRIFILMASRRLQSDRFLTVDFRPEIYTPLGMDWIARNGMTSVVLRHCPDLAGVLPRTASAFAPWRPILPNSGGSRVDRA